MLVGKFPSDTLLRNYDLQELYGLLTKACLEGDIRTVESVLDQNMASFTKSGIYLVL